MKMSVYVVADNIIAGQGAGCMILFRSLSNDKEYNLHFCTLLKK